MIEAFHLSSTLLEPGSRIAPGNFGRMLGRHPYPLTELDQNLVRELIFEYVRHAKFPDKVSRWQAAFVCPSRDGIEFLRKSRMWDVIYRVEYDETKPRHFSTMGPALLNPTGLLVHSMMAQAESYWRTNWEHEEPTLSEVMTLSPLTILERLETF